MPTRNESAMSLLIERAAIALTGRQCSALAYAVFSETNAVVRRAQEVINYTVQKRPGNGSSSPGRATGQPEPRRASAGVERSAGVGGLAGRQVRAAAVQDPDRALAGHGHPDGVRFGGEPAAEHEPDPLGGFGALVYQQVRLGRVEGQRVARLQHVLVEADLDLQLAAKQVGEFRPGVPHQLARRAG